MMSGTRKRAELGAISRLMDASIKGYGIFRETTEGYTKYCEQNLVPGVESGDFWEDLSQGDGNELSDSPRGPAKFCAAFSSSALAVNTFGPFRNHPERLHLLKYQGFRAGQFEYKLPTALKGNAPNLDFVVTSDDVTVCIESKFLETLNPKEAKFSDSYTGAIESLAEPAWAEIYTHLKQYPNHYTHLDAAQLVKHYLGIRHALNGTSDSLVLLYLYWEPSNAEQVDEFQRHRDEVADFSQRVAKSEVEFAALSYPQLWESMMDSTLWGGMQEHLGNLYERYVYEI